MSAVSIYNLETNYNIGVGGPAREKDQSPEAKLDRLRLKFDVQGLRRTVGAVLLVHMHSHPHVLLLQRKSDQSLILPGGTLRPGESDIDGLSRKLTAKLASSSMDSPKWDVGELLGQFWRPSFDLAMYPYVPPHVSKPKECRKIFLVALPEKCVFAVPTIFTLIAVPLFELLQQQRFSPDVAALPVLLSKCTILCE